MFKYIKIKYNNTNPYLKLQSYFKMYIFYSTFNQVNAALVCIRDYYYYYYYKHLGTLIFLVLRVSFWEFL